MIQTSYQINEKTIALCPAKEIDYDTIVLEQEATYRVSQTRMQLTNDACIANWSTFEGSRQAVIHHTNFRHKVPISIILEKNFYTFPTHSPSEFECHWIFFNH